MIPALRIVGVTKLDQKNQPFFLVEMRDGSVDEISAWKLGRHDPQLVIGHLLQNAKKYPVSLSNRQFMRGMHGQLSKRYEMLKQALSQRREPLELSRERDYSKDQREHSRDNQREPSRDYQGYQVIGYDDPLLESFQESSQVKMSRYQSQSRQIAYENNLIMQNNYLLSDSILDCLDFKREMKTPYKKKKLCQRFEVFDGFLKQHV